MSAVGLDLQTRREQLEAFLDLVFGERQGHMCFTLGRGGHYDEKGKWTHEDWRERHGRWPEDRKRFVEEALRLSAERVDVYVCPVLRSSPRRVKGNALPAAVLHDGLLSVQAIYQGGVLRRGGSRPARDRE